jgi:hypothetical protein
MPRPRTLLDGEASVPDLSGIDWWDAFDPPWCRLIDEAPVDAVRTRQLADWDLERDGKPLPVRVNGNTPLATVGPLSTRVWESKNPRSKLWNPGTWQRLGLHDKVWVSTNLDHTFFAIDVAAQRYYEASGFGPMPFSPYWRADLVRSFDLRIDWAAQPGSISASRIPTCALVPPIADLDLGAGGVRRALPLVLAGAGKGGYGNGTPIWPSRGTDGLIPGHPLNNGSRARLSAATYARLLAEAQGPQDEAFAWAGRHVGFIVVDKTDVAAGHAVRLYNDPGLAITARFFLGDMEVVYL